MMKIVLAIFILIGGCSPYQVPQCSVECPDLFSEKPGQKYNDYISYVPRTGTYVTTTTGLQRILVP